MKHVNIYLEDSEYEEYKAAKGGLTWKELLAEGVKNV